MAHLPYLILRNLLDAASRRALAAEIAARVRAGQATQDDGSELRLLASPPGEALLRRLQPAIEAAACGPVRPSYSVARIYARGDTLPLHLDGEDCDATLSLTLDYRALRRWPLQLVERDAATVHEIRLSRGDGVFFDAADLLHARRPFQGRSWTQLSLHYTRLGD